MSRSRRSAWRADGVMPRYVREVSTRDFTARGPAPAACHRSCRPAPGRPLGKVVWQCYSSTRKEVRECYTFAVGGDMVHRRLKARGFLGGAIVGALVVSALVVVPAAAASAASPAPLRHLASGPLPTVAPIPAHAGSHGYPYDAVPTRSSFPGAPTI